MTSTDRGSVVVGREPKVLLGSVVVATALSAVRPAAHGTWLLEVAPVALAVPILVLTFSSFRFTAWVYRMFAVAALLIALGAHYTYAEVPVGFWMQNWFGFERNHYDRIGHVAQGAVAAMVLRELLIRLTALRSGWPLVAIVTLMCLGISGGFEVVEALAGTLSGQAGDAYLGTQGDAMDAQWDMTCAFAGAVLAQLTLRGAHDRQLHQLDRSR